MVIDGSRNKLQKWWPCFGRMSQGLRKQKQSKTLIESILHLSIFSQSPRHTRTPRSTGIPDGSGIRTACNFSLFLPILRGQTIDFIKSSRDNRVVSFILPRPGSTLFPFILLLFSLSLDAWFSPDSLVLANAWNPTRNLVKSFMRPWAPAVTQAKVARIFDRGDTFMRRYLRCKF